MSGSRAHSIGQRPMCTCLTNYLYSIMRQKKAKTDNRSAFVNKRSYRYAIDSLDYLIETCCECDGEYVGGEVRDFINNLYQAVGGSLNG